MAVKTTRFDAAEHLDTPERIAAFLEAVLEEDRDDPAFIQHALGIVARAKGMSELSRQTGIDRASLYKALSEGGNPEFGTVMKVMKALGLQMKVATAAA